MPFALSTRRSVRWRPVGSDGLEHLSLQVSSEGVAASSVVIGERGGRRYAAAYRIACDNAWRVRALDLETTDGIRLALRSDGNGAWTEGSGAPLPFLAGCIDIDLAGSPFTNTLPIRRLGLGAGERAELTMVYIPFDNFTPTVDGQIYAALAPGSLYRYEAADRSFAADLPVDADGLVTDYPFLFERC